MFASNVTGDAVGGKVQAHVNSVLLLPLPAQMEVTWLEGESESG